MSDEISILSRISEENPTSTSPSVETETGFSAVNRRPHAIPDQASVSFTGLRNTVYAAAPVSEVRRAACYIRKQHVRLACITPQRDFANAKTVFATVTTTARFSHLTAVYTLPERHSRSTVVNGDNDFNAKFGKSNSGYILLGFPQAADHDGKRALS
ncbi:hypothetical protein [Dickeya solani]|uniref:Uncharacterized protein n=1 Tax=Dickeya solani TaxID=1089444 RepID=A0AAX4EWG5_9GAMM|nr:hypothetical protein [Dickeya solani]WOA51357.1 hypothetical protein RXA29_15725 [Dickeya solani]